MKKILALILALVMVLSVSVLASATETAEAAETTEVVEAVEAETEEAVVTEETETTGNGGKAIKVIVTVVQVVLAVMLDFVVTIQSGKNSGLGAISGNSDTFMAKNQSATLDAKLSKATKWIAAAFLVLTLVLNLPIWG